MTATEVIDLTEEDSDLEVAVDSMTETEEMAIVTEEIVEMTEEIVEITMSIDLAKNYIQVSMTDHLEGKYLFKINKMLLDLEVHHHTTLAPEGADQDPEDAENAQIAITQDSVVILKNSMVTEEAETSATGETLETKSTMAQCQEPTDQMALAHLEAEWERTVISVAPETSHQENQETCLQEVTVQAVIAMVVVNSETRALEDSTIVDPQEAVDSNPEAADSNPEVDSETTVDLEATLEAVLAAETETKRNKESWKRVSASIASSRATWPEIALKVTSNVREAEVETEIEEATSQEAMETMTKPDLVDYYKYINVINTKLMN